MNMWIWNWYPNFKRSTGSEKVKRQQKQSEIWNDSHASTYLIQLAFFVKEMSSEKCDTDLYIHDGKVRRIISSFSLCYNFEVIK